MRFAKAQSSSEVLGKIRGRRCAHRVSSEVGTPRRLRDCGRILFLAVFPLLILFVPAVRGQTQPSPQTATNANRSAPGTPSPTPTPSNAAPGNVQTTPGTSPNTSGGGNNTPSKPDLHDDVRVVEVSNILDTGHKRVAGLNDIVIVRVENLERLVKRAKCEAPENVPTPCQPKDISLFINGREIRGLRPESGAPRLDLAGSESSGNGDQRSSGELRYHLQRSAGSGESDRDNAEHWADLLGLRPDIADLSDAWEPRAVEVSVGLAGDYPVATNVKIDASKESGRFGLIRVRKGWLLFWSVISLLIVGALLWRARTSSLLRDRHMVLWGQERPYSLSAVQAAWWFCLIFLSFIFIWLVTGQYDLSPTALILLGIGSGTALGARVIDSNKRSTPAAGDAAANGDELNLLLSRKEDLESVLTEEKRHNREGADLFAGKKAEYDELIGSIRSSFPYALGPKHETFMSDILSDISGISFPRYQLLIWTIILGLFFIISALGRLAMPQFSETLLALMGISAGTYLGFKFPENNNVPTADRPPPPKGKGAVNGPVAAPEPQAPQIPGGTPGGLPAG